MPNVTISVPDELKSEMDKYPEVSWSEVSRKAFTQYISERKNPTPNFESSIEDPDLDIYHESGYPAFKITMRIHNKMDSDVLIDRVIFKVRFHAAKTGHTYSVGTNYDLYKMKVGSNSTGGKQIFLPLPKEKIAKLEKAFQETFQCQIDCWVYADGFTNPYHSTLTAKIPIDEWAEFVKGVYSRE